MRRFRSLTERVVSAQRTMTPGSGGGRSAIVAPQPRPLPKPETLGAGYEPLDPWGAAGDTLSAVGWHGIYTDAAAAAGGTGPVFDFGVSDDSGIQTVGFKLVPEASTPGKYGLMAITDYGSGGLEMWPDGTGGGYFQLTSVATNEMKFELGADGNRRISLVALSASHYMDIFSSATDPSAPTGSWARIFCRTNGSGKEEFCVRFNTGAIQVIKTEP